MDKFEKAFLLAYEGHGEQTDKGGEAYIKHLMRVAGTVPKLYMPVAILHDYFEDVMPLSEFRDPLRDMALHLSFLSELEIYALYLLTRPEDVSYAFYIDRLSSGGSHIARTVKIADLKDHLTKGANLTHSMEVRYRKALASLDFEL